LLWKRNAKFSILFVELFRVLFTGRIVSTSVQQDYTLLGNFLEKKLKLILQLQFINKGSISQTFYAQLLLAKIPKAQKNWLLNFIKFFLALLVFSFRKSCAENVDEIDPRSFRFFCQLSLHYWVIQIIRENLRRGVAKVSPNDTWGRRSTRVSRNIFFYIITTEKAIFVKLKKSLHTGEWG